MRSILDEVIGPDVVRALRPEPGAGPVTKPEPTLLRLLLRDLQPFAPPYPLDPLVV